jgi:uncharacterized protein
MLSALTDLSLGGVAGYAGLVLLLYLMQRRLLFVPTALRVLPQTAGLAAAQEIGLVTSDGETVIAWYVAPRKDRPLVIYFHGNAEVLGQNVERHRKLVADGTGLIALSYRGYGGSTGRPSEAGLHRDADAAYAFATARFGADRIVVWGHSLGTGVAVRLAAERAVGGVILEAPYTSAADIAARRFWFVPVRLLMKDPFRSDQRIGGVTAPVLVLHGGRDDVIPLEIGERLYDLIRAPKRFVRFPEGGHCDLDACGALAAVRAFLADLRVAKPTEGPVIDPVDGDHCL